jgi:hypothetical protein
MALNCSANLSVCHCTIFVPLVHCRSCIKRSDGKGKGHPGTGHEGPEGKQRYSSILSLTSALDGCGFLMPRSGFFTSADETRYALYRRVGGSWGRSGRVRRISTPTGIRSPDRPDRRQWLYRPSYCGPRVKRKRFCTFNFFFFNLCKINCNFALFGENS